MGFIKKVNEEVGRSGLDVRKTKREGFVDLVGKFWVVVSPTVTSDLADILVLTDVLGMMLQAKGGLHRSEIEGIYPESQKDKATKHAEMLIEAEAVP